MLWKKSKKIKALEAERELLLTGLEEGILIVDENRVLTTLNKRALELLGLCLADLCGNKLPSTSALLEKIHYLFQTCQNVHMTITDSIVLEGRRKIHLDLIAIPKPQGGGIMILQDKSSHHRVVEMGKDFVSNASHELRTPITIVKGFAETLQDIVDLPREIYLDIIDKIVRNCQRMEKLVKNLLILADLESLPPSRFALLQMQEVVFQCQEMGKSAYPHAKIEVELPCEDFYISADRDLLELAITNLIENAVKYSKENAEVHLILEGTSKEVLLHIQDLGVGIPQEAIGHIFERFYTVNKAYTRRLGGAGLGLSIVKNILDKHRGSIKASSVLGEGTRFSLSFPREKS